MVTILLLLLTGSTAAERTDFSFEVTDAALHRIAPLDGEALLDDNKFVDALRRILRDETLSPTDRVDAFYLLHRKIGLHFSGFVALPPGVSYADVFWEKAGLMNAYREALADLEIDGDVLQVVAVESFAAGHSTRLGSAVLLAALVDPPEAHRLLKILLDDRLSRASVPPIVAHYVAWSATVAGTLGHAETMAELVPMIPHEEVREDFVLAVGYHNPGPEVLDGFVRFAVQSGEAPGIGFDQAIGAVLTVLHRHHGGDAYREAWQRIRGASGDDAWTVAVDAFRDGPPPRGAFSDPPPESGSEGWIHKLWDGFEVTVRNEADTIRWGDVFSDTTRP